MKFNLVEYDGCFSLDMEAETLEDAAQIMRFKMNAKKEIRSINASAHKGGKIYGYIVLGKIRNVRSSIK